MPQGNRQPQQPNSWLCRGLGTASGAFAGAVGGVTFAVATGNVAPAELAVAAAGGAVIGGAVAFAAPKGGFNGAIVAAVASLGTHTTGGTTAEGFAGISSDTAPGAFPSPVAAVPLGVGTGAVVGAVGTSGVLGAAGTAGGALIGANAGGLAALAALSTNSALNALSSIIFGCP
jgi:hypothetical protein